MNIIEKVTEIVSISLGKESIKPHDDLKELGMDSITFIKIIVEFEETFEIEYPDDKLLINESNSIFKIGKTIEEVLER